MQIKSFLKIKDEFSFEKYPKLETNQKKWFSKIKLKNREQREIEIRIEKNILICISKALKRK